MTEGAGTFAVELPTFTGPFRLLAELIMEQKVDVCDVPVATVTDRFLAYAGLEPRTRQSGAFVGQKRLSKHGPGALRHALYLAALVAARYRSEWRDRYQRLLAQGRAEKEALTILSRAMLKVIFHLLRTGEAYDPAHIKRSPAPATA